VSTEAEKPSTKPADFPSPNQRIAWQPCTFGGVAAFAQAPWRRLLAVQVAFALLFAASAVWFLSHCCAPVITEQIAKMPEGACLTNGALAGFPDVLSSESKFLSITIAADEEADLDQSADLQIVLRTNRMEISSLLRSALGSLVLDYDDQIALDLSRSHLDPLWGAWRPVLLVAAGFGAVLCLLVLWPLLGIVYAPVAKLIAWFCDRQLDWGGAWRLSSAALLPGSVLPALGLLLYGCRLVDIFGLGYVNSVHFLVGWIYLVAAPIFAPPLAPLRKSRNPFRL
jgi:hypothetical protein